MADYYSLLAKAVSNLPKAGPEPARKAIYDRARKALVRQLRSLGPTLSEADIAREEAALETAIGKLEGQFSLSSAAPPPSRPASAPPPSRPAPPPTGARPGDGALRSPSFIPPPRPAPAVSGGRIAMPDTPLARPMPPLSPAPARPASTPDGPNARPPAPTFADRFAASSPPARPGYPPPPIQTRPTIGASAAPAPLAPRPGAPISRYAPPPAPARRVEAPSYLPEAPSLGRVAADDFDESDNAPEIDAADDLERSSYSPSESDALRPSAPSRLEGTRRSAAPWILLALVLGVALSVAIFAFLWRQKPQDLAIKEPVETPAVAVAANPAKSVERVGGAAAPTTAPVAAPTTAPAVASAAAPAASLATPAPAASVAAPAAASAANPAPASAAGATPAAQASPGIAVAARAAMLVAVAADPQKPAVSLGSVVWSEIPAPPGQPASVAVKAEADIPDLKMHAVMTLRKNIDPSLPASHTIELRVTFADGSDIKGIKDMRVPMMRRDDPPSQDALAGVRVKISDSYFLIGLNRGDAEIAHNVDLMANRGWFDFPLLLSDDRIAKLTFEKGAEGERIINEALAAWK